MSTLNLSPKNPIVLGALGIAAVWMLSQRRVAVAGSVQPSAVGASTVNGGGLNGALQALTSLGSLFKTSTTSNVNPSAAESARAAVRAGDPYYSNDTDISGTIGGWYAQAQQDAEAWRLSGMADAAAATGDPYNPM